MPAAKPPNAPKDGQRIAKLLARAGIASRREIERMIAEGRVAVSGKILDTPATILASLDGVTVDGKPVEAAQAARLFLFHKPTGVLTTERDPAGRPTIYDRLPQDLPRLVPVGRLDLNTEGLLLLTTDGELKRQLELPATGIERAYRARAYGTVTQAQLEDLIEGIEIEGVRYGAIDANLERRTGANVWIELVLTEGKNREVRRVLEHLGLKVSRLIRTRYGPFVLGDLPVGGVGEVRQADLVAFRQSLAGKRGGNAAAIDVAPREASGGGRAVRKPAAASRQGERRTSSVRPEPVEGRVKDKISVTSNRPSSPSPAAMTGATVASSDTPDQAGRPKRGVGAPEQRRDRRREAATDKRTPRSRAGRPDGQREDARRSPAPNRARQPGADRAADRHRAAPTEDPPAKPHRPKRGAGWAKAKPRPKPPGKPRGGPRR
jgi:23S rRNA pseudouridine2605 synthase